VVTTNRRRDHGIVLFYILMIPLHPYKTFNSDMRPGNQWSWKEEPAYVKKFFCPEL
jgi:hypothetical protein